MSRTQYWSRSRWAWLQPLVVLLALLACRSERSGGSGSAPKATASKPTAEPANVIELSFVYGSEKKAWLAAAISDFNASPQARSDGATIKVKGTATGSGSAVDDIVEETLKPDIWCPASDLFRPLLNQAWAAKHASLGAGKPVAPEGKPLVLSPVVIAMWQPMAKALGWPDKSIGWSDILKLSKDPKGWATLEHPEWGLFKLGHTHPQYSNSGLMAVLAEAYAAIGETRGLSKKQLDDKKTLAFLESIEASIVHYGKSTGFFADKMLKRGPRFLSAAVVYENLVIDSYVRPEYRDRELDLVAIYPKEGTFWIDNPIIVLDAPWVDAKKKKAAAVFQKYLLSKDVQTQAMQKFGFRPSDPGIAMTAPLDAAHGVDPKQPKTLLETPEPDLVAAALQTWTKTKKTVDLMFVFDRSGSMRGEPLRQAKAGASEFMKLLDDRDRVSLVLFNHEVPDPIAEPVPLGSERQRLLDTIDGTFADGGTALYEAIQAGHTRLAGAAKADPKRMHALVVLTDGRDENSKITLDDLKQTITTGEEQGTSVRLFTIAYGSGADANVLGDIAEAGGGTLFQGNASTIRQIYRDLAAFF